MNNKLQWFGTINPWDSTGNTGSNWPDSNNIPISQGPSSGHQFPWNMMRCDSANPIHESYVHSGYYGQKFGQARDYCKAGGLAFMFQMWYPDYDKSCSWSYMKPLLEAIVQYVSGYPVYIIIANEILTGNTNSPIKDINSGPFSDLGGAGSTGIDGFIQWVKELKAIFPSNCKLGINEYNACDQSTGAGLWNLQPAIKVCNLCAQHGAPLDYFGAEGYWFNTNYSGYSDPVAAINDASNQFGDATGLPIIFSECTWDTPAKGHRYYANQIDLWKAVLGAMAANRYVIGNTGPWGGYRYSTIWDGSSGEQCRDLNWLYNDTGGGAITNTLTWLQGWVAANVTGDSTPPPQPIPESPEGTTVQNDSGGTIGDSHGDAWTCVGGVVKKNGTGAGYTSNVALIAYYSHVVWQKNNANLWWKWTGSDWVSGSDPTPPPNPSGPTYAAWTAKAKAAYGSWLDANQPVSD
jgi:hypothetical protein